ncbi:hypothetical protein DFA_08752 [Cavenderia fasciculata]|uniref:Uncharacterized protein n=1 Tax=Cavenderia fasciculata TaxID=261658 RepID=F4Q451_CACFS|nr:uncharacterized protein DFA_08752 [Cavenderia fasciculata]EGG17753.1 hypothetical protein DFA_08752 [Cavenderia fasciculata]|eukprot:XP_004356237.1 hypothetical protein DFA_08752 [Cavenderia fasciculata]
MMLQVAGWMHSNSPKSQGSFASTIRRKGCSTTVTHHMFKSKNADVPNKDWMDNSNTTTITSSTTTTTTTSNNALQINLQKLILDFNIENSIFFYGSAMSKETVQLSLVSWRWFNWVSEYYSNSLTSALGFNVKFAGGDSVQQKLASKYCLFKHINHWRFDITGLNLLKVTDDMVHQALKQQLEQKQQHQQQLQQSSPNNSNNGNNNNNNIGKEKKKGYSLFNFFKSKKDQPTTTTITSTTSTTSATPLVEPLFEDNVFQKFHSPRHYSKERIEFYKESFPNGISTLIYYYSERDSKMELQQAEELAAIIELSKQSLTAFTIIQDSIPHYISTTIAACSSITSLSVSVPAQQLQMPSFISLVETVAKGPIHTMSFYSKLSFSFDPSNQQHLTDNIVTALENTDLKNKLTTLWLECLPTQPLATLLVQYVNVKKFVLLPPALGSLTYTPLLEPFFQNRNLKGITIPLDLDRSVEIDENIAANLAKLFPNRIQLKDNIEYFSISLFKPCAGILDAVFYPLPTSIHSLRLLSYSRLLVPLEIDCLAPLKSSLQEVSIMVHMDSLFRFLDYFDGCTQLTKVSLGITEYSGRETKSPSNFISYLIDTYGARLSQLINKTTITSFNLSIPVPSPHYSADPAPNCRGYTYDKTNALSFYLK